MLNYKNIKAKRVHGIIIFMALLYFVFPTNNSTLDAYNYASSIKYGVDLFEPHHLLYNAFLYVIYTFLEFINIDVLSVTKTVNSLFVILNLIIFNSILKKLNIVSKERLITLLILGFAFSSLRFGTENETYIIPITFSLLGSFYFLKYTLSQKMIYVFLCGIFASIAILFHQIHFFWWLGLFIGLVFNSKKFSTLFLYSISAIIIPIAYLLVLFYSKQEQITLNSISQFVFYDYYSGSAKSEIGIMNFIFIVISSVRTFFQVHPNILFLIKKNILFTIPIICMLYFFQMSIRLFFNNKLFSKRENTIVNFANTHIIIFLLHFLFAFYAVGNVEFLVMIPFLLSMSLFYYFRLHYRVLIWLSITLFIWNFSYGLFPNNQYKYYNDEAFVDFIYAHPNDTFLVKEQAVISHYKYKYGFKNSERIIYYNDLDNLDVFKNKRFFYTDVIEKPQIFNRSKILEEKKVDLSEFNKEIIIKYKGLYGYSTIHKVTVDEKNKQ